LKLDREPGLLYALRPTVRPYLTSTMATKLDNPKEYQEIFHWAETQKDGTIPSFATRKNDPYEVSLHIPPQYAKTTTLTSAQYQCGFGNSFSSEAVPGKRHPIINDAGV
jgi:hypothetical protein